MIFSISEIAKNVGINKITLKCWLDGYRFAKFRKTDIEIDVNDEFLDVLMDFFLNKRWDTKNGVTKRDIVSNIQIFGRNVRRKVVNDDNRI